MKSISTVYRVNEIFYSLQGEGYFTGTAAVFLRLSGCNRACPFCDTDHSGYREMSIAQIVAKVSEFPARHLVITGGEPLMQLEEKLLDALHEAGFFVQIETNGSLPAPEQVDWVTCSPKAEPLKINRIDELKIVYQSQDVEAIAAQLPGAQHYFLQPCSGQNIAETVKYIMDNPYWRLSLQTHKMIDIQ